MTDVNLKAMLAIKEEFNVNIGYSDHTLGIEVPIAAAALGAGIIEKHFTLSHELPGFDQKGSAEPWELKDFITYVRQHERGINF